MKNNYRARLDPMQNVSAKKKVTGGCDALLTGGHEAQSKPTSANPLARQVAAKQPQTSFQRENDEKSKQKHVGLQRTLVSCGLKQMSEHCCCAHVQHLQAKIAVMCSLRKRNQTAVDRRFRAPWIEPQSTSRRRDDGLCPSDFRLPLVM